MKVTIHGTEEEVQVEYALPLPIREPPIKNSSSCEARAAANYWDICQELGCEGKGHQAGAAIPTESKLGRAIKWSW